MYKAILRLRQFLLNAEIPFKWDSIYNGYQILVHITSKRWISVIQHDYSCGHEYDKLEMYGGLTEEEKYKQRASINLLGCLGNISAMEAFIRIKWCYQYGSMTYGKIPQHYKGGRKKSGKTKTPHKKGQQNTAKKVLQIKDGEIIKEWLSIREAGRTLHIQETNICKCCKGKIKSTGGYVWRYAE